MLELFFGFTTLFIFQLLGECLSTLISHYFKLIIPTPLLGMILLLVALSICPSIETKLRRFAATWLQHLALLLVPATVGLIEYHSLIIQYGWRLLFLIILSSCLTMSITAFVFYVLHKNSGDQA